MQEQHIDEPLLEVSHHTKGHVQNKQNRDKIFGNFCKKKKDFSIWSKYFDSNMSLKYVFHKKCFNVWKDTFFG